MSHPCFLCDEECFCSNSIDDVLTDLTPASCVGCGCDDDEIIALEFDYHDSDSEESFDDEEDYDSDYDDYMEDGDDDDHCPNCGHDRFDFSDSGCPQCCPHLYNIDLEEED